MTQETTATADIIAQMFDGTSGTIVVYPGDTDQPMPYSEGDTVPEGTGLSLQTRSSADLNVFVEQRCIGTSIEPGATLITPPTLYIEHATNGTYAVWMLSDAINVSEPGKHPGLNAFLQSVGEPDATIGDEVPFPGVGGWTVTRNTGSVYSVDELTVTKWGEAHVYGTIDPAILSRQMTLAISARGKKTNKDGWANKPFIMDGLIKHAFTEHKIGEKDGACLIAGNLIGKARGKNLVAGMDLLIQDYDTGEPLMEAAAKARHEGVFTILYDTHSSGTSTTPIPRVKIQDWVKKRDGVKEVHEPTEDEARDYLATFKKMRPSVLEGLRITKTHEAVEDLGVCLIVSHQPVEKFRTVEVLDRTFSFLEGVDTADRLKEWEQRYHGKAMKDGTFADQSCATPDRLYYLPRHAEGKSADRCRIIIVAGRTRRVEEYDRVTAHALRNRDKSPFEHAVEMEGGAEFKTPGLKLFAKNHLANFDVVEFMRDRFPEDERGPTSDMGVNFRCPNSDQHSEPDHAEERSFAAYNACDSKSARAVLFCHHDHCKQLCAGPKGHDSLPLLDLACQAAGIEDAKELEEWLDGAVDDERNDDEPDDSDHKAYSNPVGATRAIEDGMANPAAIAVKIGRSGFKPDTLVKLRALWVSRAKHIGMGVKDWNALTKQGKEAGKGQRDSGLDADADGQLKKMQREYAVAQLGAKLRIVQVNEKGFSPTFIEKDTFVTFNANKKAEMKNDDGEVRMVPLTKVFLESNDTRRYKKVVFEPAGERPGECNIWNGFPIEPRKGSWSMLREHLANNICQGDETNFNWMMTWSAQIVQFPAEKKGSAVVIRGRKGTGKSFWFDWLRAVMGDELALKVSHRDHITNQFNAHQQGVLLMVAEESYWAGSSSDGGVLKDLITSDEMLMTPKGIDSMKVSNYMRLAIVSNEDWVVPASFEDERRFFVLQCGEARMGDIEFFKALNHQMKHEGGLSALMYDLLHWVPNVGPLGWDELRKPPQTEWLTAQAGKSMTISEKFFLRLVSRGGMKVANRQDGLLIKDLELYEDRENYISVDDLTWFYEQFVGRTNAGRQKLFDDALFKSLLVDWLMANPKMFCCRKANGHLGDRTECYRTPSLKEIRADLTKRKHLAFDDSEDETDDDLLNEAAP